MKQYTICHHPQDTKAPIVERLRDYGRIPDDDIDEAASVIEELCQAVKQLLLLPEIGNCNVVRNAVALVEHVEQGERQ